MRTQKQLAISVASFLGKQNAIRIQGQKTLCEIAGHVMVHGDVTLFTTITSGYSNVVKTNMHKWIVDYGLASWDKEAGAYKLNAKKQKEARETYESGDDYIAYLMAGSRAYFEGRPSDSDESESEVTFIDKFDKLLASKIGKEATYQDLVEAQAKLEKLIAEVAPAIQAVA